jgi:hypothetical protein
MSVAYDPNQDPNGDGSGLATPAPPPNFIQTHPIISIALGALAAFLIYKVLMGTKQASAGGNAPQAASAIQGTVNAPGQPVGDTTGTDANGNPVYYAATSDNFTTNNTVADSYNQGVGAGAQAPVSSTVTQTGPTPAPGPVKTTQWTEKTSTHNQSLDLIAKNDSLAWKIKVTGQDIYEHNKAAVDKFFADHKLKGSKTGTGTTGLDLTIPQVK